MNILVQKFGGTSVANLECMKKVREKVLAGLSKGNKVVVVLSARAGETNHLLALASEWSPEPDKAECDALVSTGEQVSISLFSMLLRDAGIRTRSLLGWQIPIKTDDDFGNARILSIDSAALRRYLEEYDVLVVAGFQGCTEDGRITTLGRGGSDTSAVALAADGQHGRKGPAHPLGGICQEIQGARPRALDLQRRSRHARNSGGFKHGSCSGFRHCL